MMSPETCRKRVSEHSKTGGQYGRYWTRRFDDPPVLRSLSPKTQGKGKREGPQTVLRKTVRIPHRIGRFREGKFAGFQTSNLSPWQRNTRGTMDRIKENACIPQPS